MQSAAQYIFRRPLTAVTNSNNKDNSFEPNVDSIGANLVNSDAVYFLDVLTVDKARLLGRFGDGLTEQRIAT